MRPLFLAAVLAVSPVLLHAQAIQPAQTQTAAPTLQARLAEPKAFASSAAAGGVSTTTIKPVSTGVVEPKLVYKVDIEQDPLWRWRGVSRHNVAEVKLVVDANGKPTDIHVVNSLGETMDKNIVAAVSQYRFTPGTVNSQPTQVPMDLKLDILSSQLY